MSNVQYGDNWLQSIWLVFQALILSRLKGLPANFEDIPTVNVYATNEVQGDDWKAHLNDQGQAWIITPLYYSIEGLRIIRKASGGGTWDARTRQLKKHGDAVWYERKYNFVQTTNKQQTTNERTGHREYTMIEYSPFEDQPKHALCRITVDNKKSAHDRPPPSSQQPKIMEIEHTDANKGDRDETSPSHEPMQQGGNFENATGYNSLQFLERDLREHRKHYSDADMHKVFCRIMSEKLPAVSPKEHSTEAPGSNKKRGRIYTNTMEAGTSTQRQEQAKVEILGTNTEKDEPEFVHSPSIMNQNNVGHTILSSKNSGFKQMCESNSYGVKPTDLYHGTNRNCLDFGEKSSHHGNCNEKIAEQGTNTSNCEIIEPTVEELLSSCNPDDCYKLDDPHNMDETWEWFESQIMAELMNADVNSMEPTENSNPGPSTSNHATTEPENNDYNNFCEELPDIIDLNTGDLHAGPNSFRGLENGTTSDNQPWDESTQDCWGWP